MGGTCSRHGRGDMSAKLYMETLKGRDQLKVWRIILEWMSKKYPPYGGELEYLNRSPEYRKRK
jgi:hypothetical protein